MDITDTTADPIARLHRGLREDVITAAREALARQATNDDEVWRKLGALEARCEHLIRELERVDEEVTR